MLGDDALTIPMAVGSPPDATPQPLQIRTTAGIVRIEQIDQSDPYLAEIEAFSQAVLTGTPSPIDLADSVRNAGLLDAIRNSAGSGLTAYP